ncbi:MAG: hypothetical protein QOD53_1378 [Thermoleophilaceae bacterium]|jgi:hypothetical protein|nr:hypothetical protein [Thermoleophilaceae bacterium]
MKKELRPGLEEIVCDVCGRTMLKGERAEPYLAPGGRRMLVCELCADRATAEGWIRESAHDELPADARRNEPRRGLLSRLRRRPEPPAEPEYVPDFAQTDGAEPALGDDGAGAGAVAEAGAPAEPEPAQVEAPPDRTPSRPKDPRHVRAIPTNAQVKVERAIEVFNASEHPRTIAGIARSLGEPWVSATPSAAAPSEVAVVVAWELSWYHYRVDLGDENEPVTVVGKGEELDELEDWAREWNAAAAADGRLALGVGSER